MITIAAFLAIGPAHAADLDLAAKLTKAQETFQQAKSPEDYLKAAAMFQEIRDAGVENGVLLYDQGNAYMRAGATGRAIACYRQAQIYRPRDPYLDANLRFALESTTAAAPTQNPLYFWRSWLGYREIFVTMFIAGLTAFVLAMIPVVWPKVGFLRRAALVPVGVCLLFAVAGAIDWYHFDYLSQGVITAAEVTARKGNADTYAAAFTKPLPQGTEFTVVEERSGWLLVQLPDGPQGWIPSRDAVTF